MLYMALLLTNPIIINRNRQNQHRVQFMFPNSSRVIRKIIITNNKRCRAGINGLPCGICKPGHTHRCKNCGNKDSTHRSSNCPKKPKKIIFKKKTFSNKLNNSAIVLLSKDKKYIFMVYERNYRKWVIPGGKMDRKDNNRLWWCAKREWNEETGFNVPIICKKNGAKGCDIYNSYKHSTRIYFGITKNGFTNGIYYKPTSETSHASWFKIKDVVNNKINVRGCVRSSLIDLINNVGL
jgi:8-oxo-dGTP pyrophosphatase MutT (NUDIX family)